MQKQEIRHNLIVWSGNHVGFISSKKATVDVMFKNQEITHWLETKGYQVVWKEGIYLRLVDSAQQLGSENARGIKSVRIWRMNKESPLEARFQFLKDLRELYGEPVMENYECIFQEDMGTENLETIFAHLSGDEATADFGYPLSISDVIELFDEEESTFYYIDRYQFEPIDFV